MDADVDFIKLKMDNIKKEMNKILKLLAENKISEDVYNTLDNILEMQKHDLRYFTAPFNKES